MIYVSGPVIGCSLPGTKSEPGVVATGSDSQEGLWLSRYPVANASGSDFFVPPSKRSEPPPTVSWNNAHL